MIEHVPWVKNGLKRYLNTPKHSPNSFYEFTNGFSMSKTLKKSPHEYLWKKMEILANFGEKGQSSHPTWDPSIRMGKWGHFWIKTHPRGPPPPKNITHVHFLRAEWHFQPPIFTTQVPRGILREKRSFLWSTWPKGDYDHHFKIITPPSFQPPPLIFTILLELGDIPWKYENCK